MHRVLQRRRDALRQLAASGDRQITQGVGLATDNGADLFDWAGPIQRDHAVDGSHEPARLDTAVGVLVLARAQDPAATLRTLHHALGPGGRLFLLEPYRRAGWVGTLADLASPLLARLTRLRVNLALPGLVRQAGFVIATVERFTMPTTIVPLRSFCLVVAQVPVAAVQDPR